MPCSVHFTRGIRVAVFCPHPPSQRPPPPCFPALLSLSQTLPSPLLFGAAAIFISLSFLRKRGRGSQKSKRCHVFSLVSFCLSYVLLFLQDRKKNKKGCVPLPCDDILFLTRPAEKEQGVRRGEQVTCFCTRTRGVEGVKSEKDASLSVIHRDFQTTPDPGTQGHGWAYDSH